jgi:predicted small secreted protein
MLKKLLIGLVLTSALLVGCSSDDGGGSDVEQPSGGSETPASQTPAGGESQSQS